MSFLNDVLDGYITHEARKINQRLGATATQQQAWSNPPQPQNPQAQAAQLTKSPPSGFSSKQMLIAGGVAAGGLVLFLVLKK